MKRPASIFLLSLISFFSFGQPGKTKVLLIGTFHFNNPGLDVKKSSDFDVLNEKAQKELEFISDRIRDFKPTRFFVEHGYQEQGELDSLYNLYLSDNYFNSLRNDIKGYKYYSQSEVFQLGFRAAKKANIPKLGAIDYDNTSFPYDSLIASIKEANQTELLEKDKKETEEFEKQELASRSKTLTQKLLELNTQQDRKNNRSWYINFSNRGGKKENFIGAYLASEWYRRNLYMYSLIQKMTTSKDEKIVVLLGAGHVAMLEQFIKDDDRFEIVELKDLLK